MNLHMLRNIFLKNLSFKLAALFITVFIWILIAKEKNLVIGLKAKLVVKTKPGLVLSGDLPNEVNFKITGPKIFLQPLMLRQFDINVDLSHANEGDVTFNLVKAMLPMPWGVKIASISPSTIVARIEKLATKTVRVKPSFKGQPPLGYTLQNHQLSPQHVVVSGPRDEIAPITEITTNPINLSNITNSFTRSASLKVPSQNILLKDIKQVEVKVQIVENMAVKIFRYIKLEVFNCLLRCKVSPPSMSVTLKGPKRILKDLSNKDISVYIDAASKPKGTYNSKAVIKLPARTTVVKVSPIWFKLTVF